HLAEGGLSAQTLDAVTDAESLELRLDGAAWRRRADDQVVTVDAVPELERFHVVRFSRLARKASDFAVLDVRSDRDIGSDTADLEAILGRGEPEVARVIGASGVRVGRAA